MDFDNSTQRRRWTTPRKQSHDDTGNGDGVSHFSDGDKAKAIARACAKKVLDIGEVMKYPRNVILTAMAYVRRYYRAESLEGSDPSLMIVTALYLAGKVEEVPPDEAAGYTLAQRGVNMDALSQRLASKSRSAATLKKESIDNEMKLLVGLNFDLLCFHPLRTALGYVEELTRSGASIADPDLAVLKKEIWLRSSACYLVEDLIFEYPPGFLGGVCAYSSAGKLAQQLPDLSRQLMDVIIKAVPADMNRAVVEKRLLAVVQTLEHGMADDKDKEAAKVYDSYMIQRRKSG